MWERQGGRAGALDSTSTDSPGANRVARRVRNMDGAQQRNRTGGAAGFAGISASAAVNR